MAALGLAAVVISGFIAMGLYDDTEGERRQSFLYTLGAGLVLDWPLAAMCVIAGSLLTTVARILRRLTPEMRLGIVGVLGAVSAVWLVLWLAPSITWTESAVHFVVLYVVAVLVLLWLVDHRRRRRKATSGG